MHTNHLLSPRRQERQGLHRHFVFLGGLGVLARSPVCVCRNNTPAIGRSLPSMIRGQSALADCVEHLSTHHAARSEEHTSETPVPNAQLVCRLLLATTHNH